MSFIPGLHEVIARLVYEKGKLSPRDVDVRFDAPRREFVQALTRPTLDFYLFDVRENTELRHSDPMSNRANGVTAFRMPPRRFDLRFLVSA
ncbi:MAG: Pvc16 family protein, partial [Gemmatimonadaceae bacterium]